MLERAVDQVVVVLVAQWLECFRVDLGMHARPRLNLRHLLLGERTIRMPGDGVTHHAIVVHRNSRGERNRSTDGCRNHRVARHQELRHAPVVAVCLGITLGADQQSVVRIEHEKARRTIARHVGARSAAGLLIRRRIATVQERHVTGVDLALDVLQEAAVLDALGDQPMAFRHERPLEPWQLRSRVGIRPQICPRHAAAIDHRVGRRAHVALKSDSAGPLGMSTQLPSVSNLQPWYTQRKPDSSLRP